MDSITRNTVLKLARSAYGAYGAVTDHKNYRGEPMPAFEDLGETITEAWCAAVTEVSRQVTDAVHTEHA